jgi:general secretion pathway protein A
MYEAYFNLASAPFAVTPDPRYVYLTKRHREALAHLQYGILQPGGFVQLTGEVGTGKTTLCRCLLEQLPPEADVAVILNPRLGVVGLLAAICDELHIQYSSDSLDTIKTLVDALHAHLLEAHGRGRRTVLIIDEAQNLSPAVLEQVRLLTNLETSTEKLLQIILIGQPELKRLLAHRELRQLAQRITARYHLMPLSLADTVAYIRHRLRVAGGDPSLFTPAALCQVYCLSDGIPRLINVLCDRALLGTYALERSRVNAAMVRRAGREIRGKIHAPLWMRRLRWVAGLGAITLVLAGVGQWAALDRIVLPWNSPPLRSVEGARAPVVSTGEAARLPGASVKLLHGVTEAPAQIEAPPTPQPRLADILGNPGERTEEDAVFSSLFSAWGLTYRRPASGSGCDAARARGLECLFRTGNWNKIRRYDLPALLVLTLPGGERHQVALVGLGDDNVSLEIGGHEHTFSLAEVDRYWDGQFTLLWPPPHGIRVLSPGMQGKKVRWLSKTLDAAEGKRSDAAPSDHFDANLASRVQAFQRNSSLYPDGFVGMETLVHLVLASRKPGMPSLSGRPIR